MLMMGITGILYGLKGLQLNPLRPRLVTNVLSLLHYKHKILPKG